MTDSPPAACPRVLVIDDQPIVHAALRRLLVDVEMANCEDPGTALQIAEEFRPTVILLDLVMPGTSGLELMPWLRRHPVTCDVPLLMLSSTEDPQVKAEAFQAGADDYLVKIPVAVELNARVRHHDRAFRVLAERNAALARLEESLVALRAEQQRSESLLHNVLPASVVARFKRSGLGDGTQGVMADRVGAASVIFADLVGFTTYAAHRDPVEVVTMLNEVFSEWDEIVTHYGGEKIKTIGDAYMAVSGVPDPRPDHAEVAARISLELARGMDSFSRRLGLTLQVRIGIHSGPVVAGIIGRTKFAYDLWGATVNLASRMESTGVPGRIQISEDTARLLSSGFRLQERGAIHVKGVGDTRTWFLVGAA